MFFMAAAIGVWWLWWLRQPYHPTHNRAKDKPNRRIYT